MARRAAGLLAAGLAVGLAARATPGQAEDSAAGLSASREKVEALHGTTDPSPVRPVDTTPGPEWVCAGINTNRPTWGLRGGLLRGLPPAHGPAPDGPRGLIRLRYPVLPTGDCDLTWMSRHPIPAGVAFENFEMRERFHPGQRFVFGITRRTPGELGIGPGDRQPQSGVRTVAPAEAVAAPDGAASPRVAATANGPSADHVLVGVNYVAGCWEPLPTTWNYSPAVGDWRAWTESGEGGMVAPSRGEGHLKLEAIGDVFGRKPK